MGRLKHAIDHNSILLILLFSYNQIKNYDFVKSEFKDNAADFSQLVWEGSEVVGAASKKADDDTVYVVLYFNPAGNNDTMSYYENVNRVTGAGDIDPSGRGTLTFKVFLLCIKTIQTLINVFKNNKK